MSVAMNGKSAEKPKNSHGWVMQHLVAHFSAKNIDILPQQSRISVSIYLCSIGTSATRSLKLILEVTGELRLCFPSSSHSYNTGIMFKLKYEIITFMYIHW